MNILICDDIKTEADKLANMLNDRGFEVNTKVFYNARDVLAYINTGAVVDVCFLDIVMPDVSGVELAGSLRKNGYSGYIVFLSAAKDYGPESYKVKAFNYLIKPIAVSDIKIILQELTDALSAADNACILVRTHDFTRNLLLRDISYIEVENNYVFFHLIDGTELKARTPLNEIAIQLLEDSRFIRCHRSFIVNQHDIDSLKGNDFIMRNGKTIPISRNNSDVKRQYLNSITGQGGG